MDSFISQNLIAIIALIATLLLGVYFSAAEMAFSSLNRARINSMAEGVSQNARRARQVVDLYENPEFCHFLSKKFTDFYVEDYRRAYKASGGKIDIFISYSDLGSQWAPLISDGMLQEFVIPYIKRLADAIHELGAYFFFHSCGMIYPFIEGLISAGVDILDPIQPVCPEMQPENLAKEFKGRICFHGGIDIQDVLVNGTPDDVKNEVQRYKRAFNGSGYICGSSHFLQPDTNVENIFAMYSEIMKGHF